MQITIPKLSREERDEFFRKNKWLIHRLWGISIAFPDLGEEDDDNDVVLQRYTDRKQKVSDYGEHVEKALNGDQDEEELQEELEALEDEIEDLLEEIEDDLEEMEDDGLEGDDKELVEELGEIIDELQDALDDDAGSESDNNKPDDLTRIKGLGPKTAEGLLEVGVTSFKQVAELTEEEVEVLDEDIRNFAKSYKNKNFKQQAKDLL